MHLLLYLTPVLHYIESDHLGTPRVIVEVTRNVGIWRWRQFYNERRPHSAHRYKPPATVRRAWRETDTIQPGLTA